MIRFSSPSTLACSGLTSFKLPLRISTGQSPSTMIAGQPRKKNLAGPSFSDQWPSVHIQFTKLCASGLIHWLLEPPFARGETILPTKVIVSFWGCSSWAQWFSKYGTLEERSWKCSNLWLPHCWCFQHSSQQKASFPLTWLDGCFLKPFQLKFFPWVFWLLPQVPFSYLLERATRLRSAC